MRAADPAAWADKWIGRPFEDRGRGPRAFDCWGLVRAVLEEQRGVELPRWDDYETTSDQARLAAVVVKARPRFVRVELPEVCDLVLFRMLGSPSHVGVCVGGTWFLHVMEGVNSALERWSAPAWSARVEGFYRWNP